jgi:hypothetical protein
MPEKEPMVDVRLGLDRRAGLVSVVPATPSPTLPPEKPQRLTVPPT